MPVKPCQREGTEGHKYGDSGKCFTGSSSKAKAAEQGQAIRASGFTGDEAKIFADAVQRSIQQNDPKR